MVISRTIKQDFLSPVLQSVVFESVMYATSHVICVFLHVPTPLFVVYSPCWNASWNVNIFQVGVFLSVFHSTRESMNCYWKGKIVEW